MKTIVDILRMYNELDPEIGEEIAHIKYDIQRALENVNLTDKERAALAARFLITPAPPQRDRRNRRGGYSGRPKGGTTQAMIAAYLITSEKTDNAKQIEITRTIQGACHKLAAYLGPEYSGETTNDPSQY